MPTATGSHRARNLALVALAAGSVASILASVLSAANGRPPEIFLPIGISSLAYAASGAVLIFRRPDNLIGPMLLAAGIVPAALVALRYVFPILVPLNIAFGFPATTLPLAYVLLSFPSGRLVSRAERLMFFVFAGFGTVSGIAELVTVEPMVALSGAASPCTPCTANPFRLFDPSLYFALQDVIGLAALVVIMATFAVVIRRWRASQGLTRRALTPVLVGGIVLAIVNGSLFALSLTALELPLTGQVLLMTRLLIPIGLVAVLLRFYAARSAVTRELLRMGRGTSVVRLEAALRQVLHDPLLTVARWSSANSGYVGTAGGILSAPTPGADQTVLSVTSDGEPVAVVVHDATLQSDRELLDVVSEAVRYTLDVSDLRDELTARGGDVSRLPRGAVTFLFGDVERSTELVSRLGDEWPRVLAILREQVRGAAQAHRGEVVDMRADECFLVFAQPADALRAAVELRARLAAQPWPGEIQLRMRFGLHTGVPTLTASGYAGIDVHRASRVMGAAAGGQIVTSAGFATAIDDELARVANVRPLGSFQLRGFSEKERLYIVTDPVAG